jgi:TRAP-type mannitol/chloroaromatic compound transport system permease large subunit
MRAMAPPEITLVDIYRSIVPFFILMVLSLIILMIFPQITLWLPQQYAGR